MGLVGNWVRRLFGSNDTDDEEREIHRERTTRDVTQPFTEYKVTIQYENRTRTEYATNYTIDHDTVELYTGTPWLNFTIGYAGGYAPIIYIDDGAPLLISLNQAQDVEFSVVGEYMWVAEDVPVITVYEADENGDRNTIRTELPDDFDADDYEIVRRERES